MIAVQLVVNGLIAGSIYALVAAGFSLIYATNRFVHFAHGTTITVSAYLLYTFFSLLSLPFAAAAALTVAASAALGWAMHRGLYQPLKARGSSNAVLLIAGIGLMIFLENFMLLLFGADVKTVDFFPVRKGIELGLGAEASAKAAAIITPLQMVIVAVALVLLALLYALSHRTKLGTAMRAVADNSELAKITGINIARIYSLSFIIGSCIAGLAAVLVALEQNIEPAMGTPLIIKGFTGAVIGGVTSVPGAVLGSYVLGLAENVGIWWLPSGYKDAIAFILLFIFLLFRPSGILGISKGVRE